HFPSTSALYFYSMSLLLLFFIIPRPPSPTLFPYTTLFRSNSPRKIRLLLLMVLPPPFRPSGYSRCPHSHRTQEPPGSKCSFRPLFLPLTLSLLNIILPKAAELLHFSQCRLPLPPPARQAADLYPLQPRNLYLFQPQRLFLKSPPMRVPPQMDQLLRQSQFPLQFLRNHLTLPILRISKL